MILLVTVVDMLMIGESCKYGNVEPLITCL